MARSKTMANRRAFWLNAQGGVCHLMRTPACVAAHGQMLAECSADPRSASWDHLKPRNGRKERNLRSPVLLACIGCNVARGHTPLAPDDSRFARAAEILKGWRTHAEQKRQALINAERANAAARRQKGMAA